MALPKCKLCGSKSEHEARDQGEDLITCSNLDCSLGQTRFTEDEWIRINMKTIEDEYKEFDVQGKNGVYQAISLVQGELAKIGVAKNQKNTQQGYTFRGIDDIYNALAGLLAKHQLVTIPFVINREVTERVTPKGTVLFYVSVTVDYHLVSGNDGSCHTARVYGEAMDSGDKATNKAMSAAYKYFMLQTFCIPTEGDNDADATTHEVAADISSKILEVKPTAEAIIRAIANDEADSVREAWNELDRLEQEAIWTAKTKGGYFTQDEKTYIRNALRGGGNES